MPAAMLQRPLRLIVFISDARETAATGLIETLSTLQNDEPETCGDLQVTHRNVVMILTVMILTVAFTVHTEASCSWSWIVA